MSIVIEGASRFDIRLPFYQETLLFTECWRIHSLKYNLNITKVIL